MINLFRKVWLKVPNGVTKLIKTEQNICCFLILSVCLYCSAFLSYSVIKVKWLIFVCCVYCSVFLLSRGKMKESTRNKSDLFMWKNKENDDIKSLQSVSLKSNKVSLLQNIRCLQSSNQDFIVESVEDGVGQESLKLKT